MQKCELYNILVYSTNLAEQTTPLHSRAGKGRQENKPIDESKATHNQI